MVRKLHAALAGAAVSVLALVPAVPASAATAVATAIGGKAAPPAVPGTVLVTTNVAAPVAAPAGSAAVSGLEAVTADPATSRPGGTVDLRTFADCGGTETGSVTSPAFAVPVSLALAADGGLYAEARVAGTVRSGTYPVRELCQGRAVATGTLTVASLGAPDTGGGWGATRTTAATTVTRTAAVSSVAAGPVGADVLGGARGRASLALIGAAALGGLARLRRRFHG
jgi:hypothetical protein